jgi:hypothetical protein
VTILNDGTKSNDVLNELCGADFVKVNQKPPKNFEGFVDGERWIFTLKMISKLFWVGLCQKFHLTYEAHFMQSCEISYLFSDTHIDLSYESI